jgi:hypothetical protein
LFSLSISVSNRFYNDLLKSGVTPEQRPIPIKIQFIHPQIPLMFVDVDQGYEIIHGSKKKTKLNTVSFFLFIWFIYLKIFSRGDIGVMKDVILISLVWSNDENEIGFLVNEQRMNVLLTRAKRAMIVFGNKKTLISNDLWKNWIESVPNVNAIKFLNDCLVKLNPITDNRRQNWNNNSRREHWQ